MPSSVRLLYLATMTILVVAGMLLGARLEAPDPAGRLPAECTRIPEAAVAAVVDGGVTEATHTVEDGVRYGTWVDPDGTIVLQVRCARAGATEVAGHRAAVAAGELEVLDTEPAATLAPVGTGTLLRQVDGDTGLSRTWFVAGDLSAPAAVSLIEATTTAGDA